MQVIDSLSRLPMSVDPGHLLSFRTNAETDLAAIRSGLLIFLQDLRSTNDLEIPANGLQSLRTRAIAVGLDNIAALSSECEQILISIPDGGISFAQREVPRVLDLIAKMEAELLSFPLDDGDHDFCISGFLDDSFDRLTNGSDDEPLVEAPQTEEEFEIDEETLDIFRSEASELLESISLNLQTLNTEPNDLDALWNIRRCAHTFKGAAGVIGLKEASELAHRVEDLLDRLAENQEAATKSIVDLLTASTGYLNEMTLGCGNLKHSKILSAIYAEFDRVVSENPDDAVEDIVDDKALLSAAANSVTQELTASTVKPPPAPIVRVALDKLDDLLNLTQELAANRSTLAQDLAELSGNTEERSFEKIRRSFDAQRRLTNEIQEKLLHLRMVRFGMLTTRLNRAVHVTCQEENKKAELLIENENCEIDTQILDLLVEPLLHLLRNAVVHGIEPPERRRLVGKPEKGRIRISVESSIDDINISVEDDGRGISPTRLREKAVALGVMEAASINYLSDSETLDLIFLRGLTTADKLNLNAGRGVGMSIVRESIGSIGGSISIASESQKGTTFRINIPLALEAVDESEDQLFYQDLSSEAVRYTNNLHILVVDDSSSVRQMIKRMIEDEGWKCTTAIDGINAAEMLSVSESRPDMILTDLEMPNLDGYELLELLKNDDELCEIPVVMVTSRSGQAHREKALGLGAADFITKPFQAKTLIKIIEQHCGSPRI